MKKPYFILAIDTSCDDTSAAVVENDRVLSNVISSQIKYHRQYGGVVPNIAKRMHQSFNLATGTRGFTAQGSCGWPQASHP